MPKYNTDAEKAAYLSKLPKAKAAAWLKANPSELEVLGLYVFPDAKIIPSTSPPSGKRLVSPKKWAVWYDRGRNR